jgi:hypothetical protein
MEVEAVNGIELSLFMGQLIVYNVASKKYRKWKISFTPTR